LSDGRWKLSGSKAIKFTEPDERLAVTRFRQLTNGLEEQAVSIPRAVSKFGDIDSLERALAFTSPPSTPPQIQGTGPDSWTEDRLPKPSSGDPQYIHVVGDTWEWSPVSLQADAVWGFVRRMILEKPQLVAEKTGIEQIGYLSELRKPTVSPALESLGDLYAAKPSLSSNEASRSKLFWKEFCKAVGVETVKEINHTNIAAYETVVQGGKYAPKSILHRYSKVRTVLAYAIKRGVGIEDCRRALDVTAMLEIKNHTPLDPKPISVDQFWSVHKTAIDAGDETFATLMLTALNGAMYGGEVAALRWEELNLTTGELVSRRSKTGVSRVAVLWPETRAALKKLPRVNDECFHTRVRSYTTYSVLAAWKKYRTVAGLGDDVVFSMIRDAAFTVACKVSLDQARVLAGHRLPGASDHYIRRDASFVAKACAAVRKTFAVKADKRRE